jgi:hypothetical protein
LLKKFGSQAKVDGIGIAEDDEVTPILDHAEPTLADCGQECLAPNDAIDIADLSPDDAAIKSGFGREHLSHPFVRGDRKQKVLHRKAPYRAQCRSKVNARLLRLAPVGLKIAGDFLGLRFCKVSLGFALPELRGIGIGQRTGTLSDRLLLCCAQVDDLGHLSL